MVALRNSLKGRTRRAELKKKKNKRTECEERWGKKIKKGSKKTSYLSQRRSVPKESNLPVIQWGGSYQGIKFTQTCTIDCGLQVMSHLYSQSCVQEQLDSLATSDEPFKVLRECILLIRQNEIPQSKFKWLSKTQTYKIEDEPSHVVWNVWGSEETNFISHLAHLQKTISTSQCSESTCKKPTRVIQGTEIILK